MTASPADRLPPRLLPILYFGLAHLSLAVAFLLLATRPEAIVGFFYHPRMIAVVHLVTLGWISASILGAVYMIGPIALRMHIGAGPLDYVAFACFGVGTAGMVGHFWLDSYRGMLWSAGTLLAGLAWVAARVWGALRAARLPGAIKAHVGLAFLNVLAAGILGFLIGLEKLQVHVLPGFVLDSVYAHAHLAAVGWATMMVVGTGYRLFPMFLPAAMPGGRALWGSALALEGGAVGVFVGLMLASPWTAVFAVLLVAGLVVFFQRIVWMRRSPRPSPKGLKRPDYGMGHALIALAYLVAATPIGMTLLLSPTATWKAAGAIVYAVFALLGFLAQMVVGMEGRLLPMFAWMQAYAASDFEVPPPSPHDMPVRRLQALVFVLWLLGVPGLAVGLAMASAPLVSAVSWGMSLAVILQAANAAVVVRHAFAVRPATEGDAATAE